MGKLPTILLLIIVSVCDEAPRSGIMLQLRKKALEALLPSLLPQLNEQMRFTKFKEAFYGDGSKIFNIVSYTEDIGLDQIRIDTSADPFGLPVLFLKLKMKSFFDVEADIFGYKALGKGESSYVVTMTYLLLDFKAFDEKDPKPWLRARSQDLSIDPATIVSSLEIYQLPNFLTNFLSWTKQTGMNRETILSTSLLFERQINNQINELFTKHYPLKYDVVDYNFSIFTKAVEQSVINYDHILLKIDGTFSNPNIPFKRDINPLPLYEVETPQLITLVVSETSIIYLIRALYGFELKFFYSVFDMKVSFVSEKPTIKMTKGEISLTGLKLAFNVSLWVAGETATLTTDSKIKVSEIDHKKNSITFEVLEFRITESKYSPINLPGFLKNIIEGFIITAVKKLGPKEVAIPELPKEIDPNSLELRIMDHQMALSLDVKL